MPNSVTWHLGWSPHVYMHATNQVRVWRYVQLTLSLNIEWVSGSVDNTPAPRKNALLFWHLSNIRGNESRVNCWKPFLNNVSNEEMRLKIKNSWLISVWSSNATLHLNTYNSLEADTPASYYISTQLIFLTTFPYQYNNLTSSDTFSNYTVDHIPSHINFYQSGQTFRCRVHQCSPFCHIIMQLDQVT